MKKPDFNAWWARMWFTSHQRIRLFAKLAKLLDGGLALLRALEDLYERESQGGRKPNEPLAYVLGSVIGEVRSGARVGQALSRWVPAFEYMIISAGEEAGDLPGALRSVITFSQSASKIRRTVWGGALYPAVIMLMVMAYLIMFGTYIIPKFAVVSDPKNWHGLAYSLYVMSEIVGGWLWVIIAVPSATVLLVGVSMSLWRGRARVWFDHVPPWSIYRMVVGSGFLTAMAALVQSGTTVERAVININRNATPWLRERLDEALFGLKSGLNLGEALRRAGHDFPSKDIINDLCVYARFGGFATALKQVSEEWLAEGVKVIEGRMKAATGAAVLVLALMIIWIAAGFFDIQQEIINSTRKFR